MKNKILILCLILPLILLGQIPTNGMVAWYTFNNTADDSSPNAFNGTEYGGITYVTDRNGNANSAINFDGINDYVALPKDQQLQPNFPVTISFWINYDSSSVNRRAVFDLCDEDDRTAGIWFNSSAGNGGYAGNFGDGSFAFNSSTRRSFVSNAVINNNVWTHIVLIIRGYNDFEIYENCNLTTGNFSGNGGNLFYNANVSGSIGRHDRVLNSGRDYFDGQLDDFIIWNRALTSSEILQVCSATASVDDITNKTFMNFEVGTKKLQFFNTENLSEYSIYDLSGRIVLKSNNFENRFLNEMNNGIYIIQIKDSTGNSVETRKILI